MGNCTGTTITSRRCAQPAPGPARTCGRCKGATARPAAVVASAAFAPAPPAVDTDPFATPAPAPATRSAAPRHGRDEGERERMVADVDAYLHGRATITTIATRWLADQRAVSALHRVGHVVAGDPARAAAAVDGLRAACDAATGARDDVDDRWAAAERATRTDDRTRPLADLARLLTRHDRSR